MRLKHTGELLGTVGVSDINTKSATKLRR